MLPKYFPGPPCAAMRDMGRAVTPAIEALVLELDTDIPVLACHQHFLADIGKDLLEPCHSDLRGFFRRTKTRPKLRSLVRELGRKIGEQIDESRKAVQQWQSMAEANYTIPEGRSGLAVVRTMTQWILDYKERRPKRGPSEDIRNAIDTIRTHVDTHGNNLWGHAILSCPGMLVAAYGL